MKHLLLIVLLMTCRFSYADTVNPYIIFSNGLRLDSNELSDVMNTPKGLGFMFDDDLSTSWKYQKRDEWYGTDKQRTLRIRSPHTTITSIDLHTACGGLKHLALVENNKIIREAKSKVQGEYVLAVGGKKDFLVEIEDEDVCISDMKIYAGNVDLTKDASFIVSGGGGYADVFFYAKHKWVDKFDAGNTVDFYFLEDGGYACFIFMKGIGPLGGIRIYNTKTLGTVDILKNENVLPDSVKWNSRTVSGMLKRQEKNGAEENFSMHVNFP